MKAIIVLNSADNVGNAMEDVAKGDAAGYSTADHQHTVTAVEDIPFGFKIALRDIAAGEDILKYGEVIGVASCDIHAGECVHIHNVGGKRGRGDKKEISA